MATFVKTSTQDIVFVIGEGACAGCEEAGQLLPGHSQCSGEYRVIVAGKLAPKGSQADLEGLMAAREARDIAGIAMSRALSPSGQLMSRRQQDSAVEAFEAAAAVEKAAEDKYFGRGQCSCTWDDCGEESTCKFCNDRMGSARAAHETQVAKEEARRGHALATEAFYRG